MPPGATVRLYDGATLKHTITAAGGLGGEGREPQAGEISSHGAAYGSGGNGGAGDTAGSGGSGDLRAARGGNAAIAVVSDTYDLSTWTTPRIQVVIGAGGAPGSAPDSNWMPATAGTPGRLVYTYSVTRDTPADVVPLEPTAIGSFVTASSGGAGSLPDLGPGIWILHRGTSNDGIGLGQVTIGAGNVVNIYNVQTATIIASQTPTYTGSTNSRTVHYSFYSMGAWG